MQSSFQAEESTLLHRSSLILKRDIKDTPGLSCTWPPTSEDLNISTSENVIPPSLFNFLAYITNTTTSTGIFPNSFLPTNSESERRKLLSICQDVISLASHGHKLTPKSLALGLSTRHISGSKLLVRILSGLGHCSSRDSVVRLETSLALSEAEHGLPKGTVCKIFTILVWDNIDFEEETPSGSGTTHHTNGIIIQPINLENVSSQLPPQCSSQGISQQPISTPISTPLSNQKISKRQRLFDSPRDPLSSYLPRSRKGPSEEYAYTANSVSSLLESIKHTPITLFENTKAKLYFEYLILKYSTQQDRNLPSYPGFNMHLSNSILFKSKIGYLPTIPASPTQMDTVQTIGDRSLEIVERLGLQYVVLVFDQAVYCKFQEIRLGNSDWEKKFIVRLGEFHDILSFCGVIGKRFGSAGLTDILVESGILAQGSVNGVINGKKYNRALRCHRILSEALFMLLFDNFFDSIDDEVLSSFQSTIQDLKDAYEEGQSLDQFYRIAESASFLQLQSHFNEFIKKHCEENPTFALWCSYLHMTGLLFNFVHATRTSDWNLHLSVLQEMLPYYAAYDRIHYTRWLPIYLIEMSNLSKTHPECYDEIKKKGFWTAKRTMKPYTSLACDQTIEQTLNKDSKSKGGIVGFTLSPEAVDRWTHARSSRASILQKTEEMAGIGGIEKTQKYLRKSNIDRYNADVAKLVQTISTMINPFDTLSATSDLICISSGVKAQPNITNDYASAVSVGNGKITAFLKALVETQDYSTRIPHCNLKTFSDNNKRSGKIVPPKQSKLRDDRKLFGRMMIAARKRPYDFKEYICNPSGTTPLALSNADNTLCKTSKVLLLLKLQEDVGLIEHQMELSQKLPNSALILDGMAELHQLTLPLPKTFKELSTMLQSKIVSKATRHGCKEVHFVVDRYLDTSIKSNERQNRSSKYQGAASIKIYGGHQHVPRQWKKFLAVADNKTALLQFIFDSWSKEESDVKIYTTFDVKCKKLMVGNQSEELVPSLECDHEEADTRLLLHALHASSTCDNIIICSPDTDVAVITLALCDHFATKRLFFLTGSGKHKRMLDLTKMQNSLTRKVGSALIGLHCFTGCDSVSAFYGKGKVKAYTLMISNPIYIDMFIELGKEFYVADSSSLFTQLQEFVCELYGDHGNDVNESRYRLFCRSSGAEETLPPNKSALLQHAKRACYQAAIYKRALISKMNCPSPVGYGWNINSDLQLQINWFSGTTTADLLKIVTCKCKTGCKTKRCVCKSHSLLCTELCQCATCENVEETHQNQAEESDDSSDSDSDEDDVSQLQ